MHLADTFIQSDLGYIQAINFLSVCYYIILAVYYSIQYIIVFQYIIIKMKCIKHYVMARFRKLGLLNYNSIENECVP